MGTHPQDKNPDISISDIFFITGRINAKEVEVKYCPTGNMVGDYFTKPLQGSLFKKFRDQIMNIQDERKKGTNNEDPAVGPRSVLRKVIRIEPNVFE